MGNGSTKPGDASADKWRDVFDKHRKESDAALTRLEVRAEMKSQGEEEISSVIDQRALEAQRRKESSPPDYATQATWFVRAIKSPWQALVGIVLIIAALLAYVAHLRGGH